MNFASALPFACLLAALGFVFVAAMGYLVPPRLQGRTETILIAGTISASALLALPAAGQPTGNSVIDALFRAAFAALLTAAGVRARPTPVVVVSAAVVGLALFAATRNTVGLTSVAVGAATFGGAVGRRVGLNGFLPTGAFVAAGLSSALLRLPTSLPTYTPAIGATLVSAVVLGSGYRMLHRLGRQRVRRLSFVVGGVGGTCLVFGMATLLLARSDIESGVASTRTGLVLAEQLDLTGSKQSFRTAQRRLQRASDRTGALWAKPSLLIPALAQNLRALHDLSDLGVDLSSSAEVVTGAANLDKLRPAGGAINIEALRDLAPPLARAQRTIEKAERSLGVVNGIWIAAPIKSRAHPLYGQLARAKSRAATGVRATEALPAILGADRPRRYLLIVPSPAETRGGGGVLGNFGEIEIDRGKLTLARFDRISTLTQYGNWTERVFTASQEYLSRYQEFTPQAFFNNLLLSPDFPTNAKIIAEQYPQTGGQRLDGVISIDPYGLAALLRFTGPVRVPGWPDPITSTNAAKVMLNEIYAELAKDVYNQQQRLQVLQDVSLAVWQDLTTKPLPSPTQLAMTLGPIVQQRRIQLWMADPVDQNYMVEIGASGDVAPVIDDAIGIVGQNGGPNKIDYYLQRDLTYNATVLADGTVNAVTTVRLHNAAPPDGLPDYIIGNSIENRRPPRGTNTMRLSIYSPQTFTKITYQGREVTFNGDREFGRNVATSWLDIPPGEERTLTFSTHGKVSLIDGIYRLDIMYQPMVNADTVHLSIATPGGWVKPAKDSTLRVKGDALVGTFSLTRQSAVVMRRVR